MTKRFTGLKRKIINQRAKIAIIGLGYVGLPLAVEFAEAGFKVVGLELSEEKVKKLRAGKSYISDVPSVQVKSLIRAKRLVPSTCYSALDDSDIVIVCVPTPLNRTKDPDMSYILSALEKSKPHIKPGVLMVLESTTYPGTTDEVIRPVLERKNFKVGKDFFLCFSPERIDPANRQFKTSDIPKVVGGTTSNCTKLYSQIIDEVHPVSSTQVAEMAKLIENTFRIVNIGLVNELAIISHRLGVDVWEAIHAASTKPFGYMPFFPGPGIGGHCIGIDPVYLSWKARIHGAETRFIDLASRTNAGMPEYVVKRITQALNDTGQSLRKSNILILGISYKRDVDDMRESPALEIISHLKEGGARVEYHDPFVNKLEYNGYKMRSVALSAAQIRKSDLILILTDHTDVDYEKVVENASLIFDTRNALKIFKRRSKIVRL